MVTAEKQRIAKLLLSFFSRFFYLEQQCNRSVGSMKTLPPAAKKITWVAFMQSSLISGVCAETKKTKRYWTSPGAQENMACSHETWLLDWAINASHASM